MERGKKAPRCLLGAIMGRELIKRAVDASAFVINLTCALIKFVMTAALVPVRRHRHDAGVGGLWGGDLT